MTDGARPDAPPPRRRRHRRATRPATGSAAAGDAAPQGQTTDDTDVGWGEVPDGDARRGAHEKWLNEQRPPHWE
jgi:hypothetical protein